MIALICANLKSAKNILSYHFRTFELIWGFLDCFALLVQGLAMTK
ncbi:hypothetical protein ACWIUD_08195 [Helicobacter sp. 23-1044]